MEEVDYKMETSEETNESNYVMISNSDHEMEAKNAFKKKRKGEV